MDALSPEFTAGLNQWIADKQSQKTPLPSAAHHVLSRWRSTKNDDLLDMTTFRHVKSYWETGEPNARLPIGLADIGYTRKEIDELKTAGKMSLEDVLDSVLLRGVAKDSDDDE